ncbi:Bgt-1437 [Blumeria graminis f. sp. tritici]|uniref:Bgt-1437 n=2 Tax=Blumeria graminis f. sp. tritici TaxID=62690 RepID=A0A061HDR0_BLUGR|nr:hypothetical protein BGT96224_1437 [Blumeria graminis f. sp. tritici 96224]VCU41338.1 Bgt-1437 [Blumeria graminis f. sp. tritici]
MSSRQLRKLQQKRDIETAKSRRKTEEESGDELEYEPFDLHKPAKSLFANFNDLGVEDVNDDTEEHENLPAEQQQVDTKSTPSSKRPRKVKKRSKKAAKSDANVVDRVNANDIERVLKELNIKTSVDNCTQALETSLVQDINEKKCAIFGIQSKHLKVANETRKLFGKAASVSKDDASGTVRQVRRRRQRGQDHPIDLETILRGYHAPGKGLSELTLRRNFFIQGKKEWPAGTSGRLTMEIVDDQASDGTIEFRYVHSQSYQEVQNTFHHYTEIGDPQNLIELLVREPDHISLLMQVSKIAQSQGDHALASDLLERALFYMGRATTTYFHTKLSQGKARLDFKRPENRELWLAGYQYIKSLMMKGTYKTALEWSKLIFNLDPVGDDYCMRLLIHNLALRAHESNWLLDLYDLFQDQWYANDGPLTTTPSLALAALQLRDQVKARKLLTESMTVIPWLFARLFSELNLDLPPSIWGNEPNTAAEILFTDLYISQTRDLWDTPEVTSILMEIGHSIKRDNHDTEKRFSQPLGLDVARFVYLDNSPGLMALVPGNLLHRRDNSDSDPLPPVENLISYEPQRLALTGQYRNVDAGGTDIVFDQIAAMANMLPRFPGQRNREENINGNISRQELEDLLVASSAGGNEFLSDNNQPGQRSVPLSIVQRLIEVFWRPREFDDEADGARLDQESSGWETSESEDDDDGARNNSERDGHAPNESLTNQENTRENKEPSSEGSHENI